MVIIAPHSRCLGLYIHTPTIVTSLLYRAAWEEDKTSITIANDFGVTLMRLVCARRSLFFVLLGITFLSNRLTRRNACFAMHCELIHMSRYMRPILPMYYITPIRFCAKIFRFRSSICLNLLLHFHRQKWYTDFTSSGM